MKVYFPIQASNKKCFGPTYFFLWEESHKALLVKGMVKKSDMVREEEAGIIFCQMRRDKCVAPQTLICKGNLNLFA